MLGADLVIGAVLVPGARAPKLVGGDDVRGMRDGSVLVDISIDQGGCFATSRPTTHDAPTFVRDGVVHYCVTNMPGVVPRTATLALNNVTLPYVRTIAEKGWRRAIADDAHLAGGLNVAGGTVWHEAVAESLDAPLPAAALKTEAAAQMRSSKNVAFSRCSGSVDICGLSTKYP